MPDGVTPTLVVVIGLAITFDYINGFHDTANAIATSVSTRALRPGWAIAMSSAANFAGALVGTKVALTISGGIIDPNVESQTVIAAALVGAIIWNLITWRLGIPSSSSHALIGGLLGASLISAGISSWQIDGVITKVLIPLVASPVIGFVLGLLFMALLFNLFRKAHPGTLNGRFRRLIYRVRGWRIRRAFSPRRSPVGKSGPRVVMRWELVTRMITSTVRRK